MKESESVKQIKDKFFNGYKLDNEEVSELLQYIKELEALLDVDGENKQSSSEDGFVKYGDSKSQQ